jgi:hypothetical protein
MAARCDGRRIIQAHCTVSADALCIEAKRNLLDSAAGDHTGSPVQIESIFQRLKSIFEQLLS